MYDVVAPMCLVVVLATVAGALFILVYLRARLGATNGGLPAPLKETCSVMART